MASSASNRTPQLLHRHCQRRRTTEALLAMTYQCVPCPCIEIWFTCCGCQTTTTKDGTLVCLTPSHLIFQNPIIEGLVAGISDEIDHWGRTVIKAYEYTFSWVFQTWRASNTIRYSLVVNHRQKRFQEISIDEAHPERQEVEKAPRQVGSRRSDTVQASTPGSPDQNCKSPISGF